MKHRTRQTCKSIRSRTSHLMRTHRPRLQSRFGQTSEGDGAWLNSLSRVDDAPASLPTAGVSAQPEQNSFPPTRRRQDEPPTNSPTHSLLQSLRAELQRHQDTTASLKSERDALNVELDRRKDLETSGFRLGLLPLAIDLKMFDRNRTQGCSRKAPARNGQRNISGSERSTAREQVTLGDCKVGGTRGFARRLSFRKRKVVSVIKRRGSRFVPQILTGRCSARFTRV